MVNACTFASQLWHRLSSHSHTPPARERRATASCAPSFFANILLFAWSLSVWEKVMAVPRIFTSATESREKTFYTRTFGSAWTRVASNGGSTTRRHGQTEVTAQSSNQRTATRRVITFPKDVHLDWRPL